MCRGLFFFSSLSRSPALSLQAARDWSCVVSALSRGRRGGSYTHTHTHTRTEREGDEREREGPQPAINEGASMSTATVAAAAAAEAQRWTGAQIIS